MADEGDGNPGGDSEETTLLRKERALCDFGQPSKPRFPRVKAKQEVGYRYYLFDF
jgi:hypothetical protein